MNFDSIFGGLLPLWIIGAPLLYVVYDMFTSPKPFKRGEVRPHDDDRAVRMASPVGAHPAVRL